MTLSEQNTDLICAMQGSRIEGRFGFWNLVRMAAIKPRFAKFRTAAAIVHGQRFKEMLRDKESIGYRQQIGNAHSQLARQTPK
jgi:hypothetical protein